ncbi:MAG TPA: hypothetical protein VEO74_05790, partial [Thermoanaerobaculia bacterium]|nr:hypothetical protein [Thermoanaerobaculia bacterium]
MSSTVTVLVPLAGASVELPSTLETVEEFLHNTGFAFTIRVLDRRDGDGWGAMLRRGVAEAKESIVVVIDPELPYGARSIGDAVAMIDSGAAEIVYGCHSERSEEPPAVSRGIPRSARNDTSWLVRHLLTDLLPDPAVHLAAFSWDAARLLFAESKLPGGGCALEIAYLANKYGFRIEQLHVDADASPRPAYGRLAALCSVVAIRMAERRNGYRAARRCPICFSSEVWTWAQIPGNLVRACGRCKCRYLNRFSEEREGLPVRRELLPNPAPSDP